MYDEDMGILGTLGFSGAMDWFIFMGWDGSFRNSRYGRLASSFGLSSGCIFPSFLYRIWSFLRGTSRCHLRLYIHHLLIGSRLRLFRTGTATMPKGRPHV